MFKVYCICDMPVMRYDSVVNMLLDRGLRSYEMWYNNNARQFCDFCSTCKITVSQLVHRKRIILRWPSIMSMWHAGDGILLAVQQWFSCLISYASNMYLMHNWRPVYVCLSEWLWEYVCACVPNRLLNHAIRRDQTLHKIILKIRERQMSLYGTLK